MKYQFTIPDPEDESDCDPFNPNNEKSKGYIDELLQRAPNNKTDKRVLKSLTNSKLFRLKIKSTDLQGGMGVTNLNSSITSTTNLAQGIIGFHFNRAITSIQPKVVNKNLNISIKKSRDNGYSKEYANDEEEF